MGLGDRRVHARMDTGLEVARYERAGKWYLEKDGYARRCVSLSVAAATARSADQVFFNLPGGRLFDHKVLSR